MQPACKAGGQKTHLNDTRSIPESRLEQHIGIGKESLLETDNDKLAALEAIAKQLADMLRVLQIECGVDFVENVHGRGFELEERHDEGKGDERATRSVSRQFQVSRESRGSDGACEVRAGEGGETGGKRQVHIGGLA